ncbi:MAG TPA: hypothetical protein VLC93_17450, partial [Myxococcota bacterium]|nr:hypothetical protein [Myxococcota bacterium]
MSGVTEPQGRVLWEGLYRAPTPERQVIVPKTVPDPAAEVERATPIVPHIRVPTEPLPGAFTPRDVPERGPLAHPVSPFRP